MVSRNAIVFSPSARPSQACLKFDSFAIPWKVYILSSSYLFLNNYVLSLAVLSAQLLLILITSAFAVFMALSCILVVSSFNGCRKRVKYASNDDGNSFHEFLDKSHPRSRHWDSTRDHPCLGGPRSCVILQMYQPE